MRVYSDVPVLPRVAHLSVGVRRPAADVQDTQQQNTADEHDVMFEEHGAEETEVLTHLHTETSLPSKTGLDLDHVACLWILKSKELDPVIISSCEIYCTASNSVFSH